MKNKLILALLLISFVYGCNDDFLERYPLSEVTPQFYFTSEPELNTYINGLYSMLPGSGVYSADFQSDNVATKGINQIVAGQHTVQTTGAEWSWGNLRKINFFLENYGKADVPQEVKNHYAGIARFFRAWSYFEKVKRFGDVPWYSGTLSIDDEAIYKPRDSRSLVMDSVLSDLIFASTHIRETVPSNDMVSKWAALALAARVGLHEGTFRKYHNLGGAEKFLTVARDAASAIIDGGEYGLYTTGDPENDYKTLFILGEASPLEVILKRTYDQSLQEFHTANGTFITTTLGAPGLTKSLINTYLNADGTPFTTRQGYDTISYYYETQNRDPRLSQTIRTPGYTRVNSSNTLTPNFDNARTGYQNIKFVMGPSYDGYNSNVNDLPIFRYAEVLLIYAEAKVELGELAQGDLDISINKLRERVGMPYLQLTGLVADPVLSARYPNVGEAVILEIRRERRVELAMEGFRYDDLMRWKAGPLLAETFEGMYIPSMGEIDLDKDGTMDIALVEEEVPQSERKPGAGYIIVGEEIALSNETEGNIIVHPNLTKVFDENKHYLFPLPRTELLLNENLTQNPGW